MFNLNRGGVTHEQDIIKANIFCDKGIIPLVVALNSLEGVITLDSCQCGVYEEAYVFFTYGNDWRDLASLLQEISTQLSTGSISCGYILRMEWWGSNDIPRAEIIVEPNNINTLACNITKAIGRINARMSELVGDKPHITLHS